MYTRNGARIDPGADRKSAIGRHGLFCRVGVKVLVFAVQDKGFVIGILPVPAGAVGTAKSTQTDSTDCVIGRAVSRPPMDGFGQAANKGGALFDIVFGGVGDFCEAIIAQVAQGEGDRLDLVDGKRALQNRISGCRRG